MSSFNYSQHNRLEFLRKNNEELLKLARLDVFKSRGKGGQKKNKTSNAIRLTFLHLTVTETRSRSKSENLAKALKKLRMAIALDISFSQCEDRFGLAPPQEITPYLHTGEIKISPKNPFYPIFVGYFLDCFVKNKRKMAQTGKDLGFTTSQILKFIANDSQLNRTIIEGEKAIAAHV